MIFIQFILSIIFIIKDLQNANNWLRFIWLSTITIIKLGKEIWKTIVVLKIIKSIYILLSTSANKCKQSVNILKILQMFKKTEQKK